MPCSKIKWITFWAKPEKNPFIARKNRKWRGKILSRFGHYSTDISYCELCGKVVRKQDELGTGAGYYEKEEVLPPTYSLCVSCYRVYNKMVKDIVAVDKTRKLINRLKQINYKKGKII